MRVAILLPLDGPHHLPAPSKVSTEMLAHALPQLLVGTRGSGTIPTCQALARKQNPQQDCSLSQEQQGLCEAQKAAGHWLQAWGAGRRLAGNGQWPWGAAEARDPVPVPPGAFRSPAGSPSTFPFSH